MTSTSKNCKVRIELNFKPQNLGAERIANAISFSLEPETKFSQDQCEIHFLSQNSSILVDIQTNDIATMRASINSYLRLVNAALKCIAITL